MNKKEGFNQVCVWPGTMVCNAKNEMTPEKFEHDMLEFFNVKVQYLEEIITGPDINISTGKPVDETGGRNDLFFAIHDDDISSFAIKRLQMGIRWIEDVLSECNYKCHIYPNHVFQYVTWNHENISTLRKEKR